MAVRRRWPRKNRACVHPKFSLFTLRNGVPPMQYRCQHLLIWPHQTKLPFIVLRLGQTQSSQGPSSPLFSELHPTIGKLFLFPGGPVIFCICYDIGSTKVPSTMAAIINSTVFPSSPFTHPPPQTEKLLPELCTLKIIYTPIGCTLLRPDGN